MTKEIVKAEEGSSSLHMGRMIIVRRRSQESVEVKVPFFMGDDTVEKFGDDDFESIEDLSNHPGVYFVHGWLSIVENAFYQDSDNAEELEDVFAGFDIDVVEVIEKR